MNVGNRLSLMAMMLLGTCILLAAWSASPVLGQSRQEAQAESRRFEVELWTDGNKSVYRIGEKIHLKFRANEDCYLTLIDFGTSGQVSTLFPNKWHPENRVEKGKTYTVPASGSGIVFRVRGPEGTEVVKAVARLTRDERGPVAGRSSRGYVRPDRRDEPMSGNRDEASEPRRKPIAEAELRVRVVRSEAEMLAEGPERTEEAGAGHSRNERVEQPDVTEPSASEEPPVTEKLRASEPQAEKASAGKEPVDRKPEKATEPQTATKVDVPEATPERVEPPQPEPAAKPDATAQPVAEPNPQQSSEEEPVDRKPKQATAPQTAATVDVPEATPEKVEPPQPEPAVKTDATAQPVAEPNPEAHEGTTIEAVALSLTVLQEALRECADTGTCSDDARFLGGMRELLGYFLDKDNGDLILLGRTEGDGPRLHTEDFLVALRNAWESKEFPGCSIDPDPAVMKQLQGVDVPGGKVFNERDLERANSKWQTLCEKPQAVRVMGVPFDSRFSKIMVEADYYMKRLVDGSENLNIPGFESVSDKMLASMRQGASRGKTEAIPMIFNRYWFSPRESAYLEGDDAVWVKRVAVGLSTEEELLNSTGQVTQSGKPHPLADEFAKSFTEKYGEIATVKPIYQELAQLYRFVALAQIMRMRNAPDEVGADLTHLLNRNDTSGTEVERQLPGIPHFKKLSVSRGETSSVFYVRNCGGVLMNIQPERALIARAETGSDRVRDLVLKSKPLGRTLAWNVTVRVPRELLGQATSGSQSDAL